LFCDSDKRDVGEGNYGKWEWREGGKFPQFSDWWERAKGEKEMKESELNLNLMKERLGGTEVVVGYGVCLIACKGFSFERDKRENIPFMFIALNISEKSWNSDGLEGWAKHKLGLISNWILFVCKK